jgi:tripartite-type tricarboxylate transporter receptor subunit TctC
MGKTKARVAGLFISFALLFGSPHALSAQQQFYQNKTITVIVGTVPGGLYDLWGRVFSRTMGK